MPSPEISIITPTFNRLDRIKRVLSAIAEQDYERDAFEVIVVSDGSTDGTDAYLSSINFPGQLRPVSQANKGPAAARNRGLSEAKGTFIVFIDDDVVPEKSLLAEHMRVHREVACEAAVIGPMLSPSDFELSPWVNWEQEMLVKQYDAMTRGDWRPTARQFYTGNASIRRELLLAAGGFDESFRRAEDVELAYRLSDRGVSFFFADKAIGWHYAERSFTSWLAAASAYGKNDAIFARDRKHVWLRSAIREEFEQRRLPLRLLLKACLGRPELTSLAIAGIRAAAAVALRVGASKAERTAYSALFGLRYCEGFVEEIGDRRFFSRDPATV